MHSRPLALCPALPSDLLTYILTYHSPSHPVTLIICQPRASFLSSLLGCIPAPLPHPHPPASEGIEQSPVPEEPHPRHPLLVSTLHQVLRSRHINLVFVPSLSHLRAYLAVFPPEAEAHPSVRIYDRPGKQSPKLVVYGILALQKDTSEWSAQGLGHTLASLVEAGYRGKRDVMIVEKKMGEEPDYFHGDEEISEVEVREEKRRDALRGWEEEVPILNGGRKVGLEGVWSGRTVEVGRVVGRWFNFEKGDWNE